MGRKSRLKQIRRLQQELRSPVPKDDPDIILIGTQGEWSLERLEHLVDEAIAQGAESLWVAVPKIEFDRLNRQIPPNHKFKLPVHLTWTEDES
jgi:hypothetical protein